MIEEKQKARLCGGRTVGTEDIKNELLKRGALQWKVSKN